MAAQTPSDLEFVRQVRERVPGFSGREAQEYRSRGLLTGTPGRGQGQRYRYNYPQDVEIVCSVENAKKSSEYLTQKERAVLIAYARGENIPTRGLAFAYQAHYAKCLKASTKLARYEVVKVSASDNPMGLSHAEIRAGHDDALGETTLTSNREVLRASRNKRAAGVRALIESSTKTSVEKVLTAVYGRAVDVKVEITDDGTCRQVVDDLARQVTWAGGVTVVERMTQTPRASETRAKLDLVRNWLMKLREERCPFAPSSELWVATMAPIYLNATQLN